MTDNRHKLKQDKFRLEIKGNLSPYQDSAAAVQVAQKNSDCIKLRATWSDLLTDYV